MITVRRLLAISSITGVILLIAILVSWERSSLDSQHIDFDKLCSMSGLAYEKGDFTELLLELTGTFNVEVKDIRVSEKGVYVPKETLFVNEEGFFVAKPDTHLEKNDADPSFYLIKGCIYHYKIKG